MKVLIETYRGWNIEFETEEETFYAINIPEEKSVKKVSYAAAKKHIDEYIKNNQEFKPIKVESDFFEEGRNIITLVGIRKDGKFMYERSDGRKGVLANYDERRYFEVNEANNPVFDKIMELRKKQYEIHIQMQSEREKLIKATVVEIRKRIGL